MEESSGGIRGEWPVLGKEIANSWIVWPSFGKEIANVRGLRIKKLSGISVIER
jgi:hypothetical protein